MFVDTDELRKNFNSDLTDAAADLIDVLESENEKLKEACRCFRHFVNSRGGSWAEMKEILDKALEERSLD